MECKFHPDARTFLAAASDYLDEESLSSNVIGVQAHAIAANRVSASGQDIWATLNEGTDVVGVAMLTPPRYLFVSRMPEHAAMELASVLSAMSRPIPGIAGEARSVGAFVDAWSARTGQACGSASTLRTYRLEILLEPSLPPGEARRAGLSDVDVVASWLRGFNIELERPEAEGDTAELASRLISAGELAIWEDDEPVALAGFRFPVLGVSRIGPVYTRHDRRRRGYGSAVTAAAARFALSGGALQVVLYADAANQGANRLYQELGFVPDHDAEERRFV